MVHAPLSASIWAPQPQPSDNSWPKTLAAAADAQPVTRKDVFGAPGAVGDGRPADFVDDTHVAQLLRTLNLTSPDPVPSKPALSLNLDASPLSPDFSPASATSSLLTPTDLSPLPHGKSSPYELPVFFNHFADDHPSPLPNTYAPRSSSLPFFEPFRDHHQQQRQSPPRPRIPSAAPMDWRLHPAPQHAHTSNDWALAGAINDSAAYSQPIPLGRASHIPAQPQDVFEHSHHAHSAPLRGSFVYNQHQGAHPHVHPQGQQYAGHGSLGVEPINFLSLLHPSSSPPYALFVHCIIKSSDQQASIFLQQKLKVADADERAKIVDAICRRGFEMMAH
ncbi:hypothetical protein H0H92_002386, partial [Tricholoma furcatifolium]